MILFHPPFTGIYIAGLYTMSSEVKDFGKQSRISIKHAHICLQLISKRVLHTRQHQALRQMRFVLSLISTVTSHIVLRVSDVHIRKTFA